MKQEDIIKQHMIQTISSMFNRNIEIINGEKLEPLKLKQFHNNQRKLATKINEIIEYIKEK